MATAGSEQSPGEGSELSTTRVINDVGKFRRDRLARRIMLGLVAVLVLLGAANAFGERSRTVAGNGAGYDLTVTFPAMTRAGLASEWSMQVHRTGGFQGPIVVATTSRYWGIFDENGLDPEPSASTTRGDLLVWEFDPPRGDTLSVDFDARLEPAIHLGEQATTSVLVGGSPVVAVSYHTRVAP